MSCLYKQVELKFCVRNFQFQKKRKRKRNINEATLNVICVKQNGHEESQDNHYAN